MQKLVPGDGFLCTCISVSRALLILILILILNRRKRPKRRNLKKAMLRSALFWDIPQRIVVLPCRRFGTTYSPIFKGQEMQRMDCLETGGYMISQKTPTSRRRPEIMKSYAVWYIRDFWTQKYIFFSIHQRVNAFIYSIYNILLFGNNAQLFTRPYMRWRPCPCSSCEHIS